MNEDMSDAYRRILNDKDGGAGDEDYARERLQEEFAHKRRIAMGVAWGFIAFEAAQMVAFVWLFLMVSDTKILIALAALFIASFETTVLMKLWYWVVHTRLLLVREVKEMRLELAELAGRQAPPAE